MYLRVFVYFANIMLTNFSFILKQAYAVQNNVSNFIQIRKQYLSLKVYSLNMIVVYDDIDTFVEEWEKNENELLIVELVHLI